MKEKDLQKLIMDYLSAQKIFHFRNNTGAVERTYNGRSCFMRYGCPGSPDIICVVDGQFVGIEVKGDKGKQSPEQKIFEASLIYNGGKYILARSLEDVQSGLAN